MSDSDNRALQQVYDAMMNQQVFGSGLQAQGMAGGSYGNALGQSRGVLQRDDIMNSSMTGRLTTSSANFQTVRKPRAEDVVLWEGKPVPEEWRGAQINGFVRVWDDKLWGIAFKSKWSSEQLMLYLSTDKFSGEQADAIAATHMEALNQRRVG